MTIDKRRARLASVTGLNQLCGPSGLLDQSHDGSGADLPRDDHQEHIHLTTATITAWRAASWPLSPCLLDRR
jgi:hypothetical protein